MNPSLALLFGFPFDFNVGRRYQLFTFFSLLFGKNKQIHCNQDGKVEMSYFWKFWVIGYFSFDPINEMKLFFIFNEFLCKSDQIIAYQITNGF